MTLSKQRQLESDVSNWVYEQMDDVFFTLGGYLTPLDEEEYERLGYDVSSEPMLFRTTDDKIVGITVYASVEEIDGSALDQSE